MITLITMSQGNPIALKRTLDSFAPYCNEVIFGDMLIFNADRAIIEGYGCKMVPMPFNYIFKNGFSACLNELASHATNDWVLYMNVGEVIQPNTQWRVPDRFFGNCIYFDHQTEHHEWFRLYRKSELQWQGLIHEELIGHRKPLHLAGFRMADIEKDSDPFLAKVYNDIKEVVYFNQYLRLVDEPESIGPTNLGWVEYAKRDYNYIKERMEAKGKRLEAFQNGDLSAYLEAIYAPEFTEGFQDSDIIHFQ